MNRKKGIDISHHQVTFEYQGNLDFIVQRATVGLIYDTKYWKFLPEVRKVGIRGAYHYFLTGKDPIEQAEFFNEAQGGQGFHFLAIDYEEYDNTLDRAGAENFWLFYQHLLTLTNKPIFLYTRELILRDNLLIWNNAWLDVPLWVARWRTGLDIETDDPLFCDIGATWDIWQYSASGNKKGGDYGVGSVDIDLNVANDDVFIPVEEEEEPMNKKVWESKTIIFFILTLLVSIAGLFGFGEFEMSPEMAQIAGVIVSVAGIILRALTSKGVEL